MDPIWIVLIVVAVIAVFLIFTYNGLVRLRNMVDEAWNQISVQLKRRHDLIPNLVNAVKGYMDFEQETLTKVIEARNAATPIERKPEWLKITLKTGPEFRAAGGRLRPCLREGHEAARFGLPAPPPQTERGDAADDRQDEREHADNQRDRLAVVALVECPIGADLMRQNPASRRTYHAGPRPHLHQGAGTLQAHRGTQ